MPTELRVRALRSDALDRLIAGASSAAVLALALMVLLFQRPMGKPGDVEASPLRLRFIFRERASPEVPADSARVDAGPRRGGTTRTPPPAAPTLSVVPSMPPQAHLRLYGRDGRVQIPEGIGTSPPVAGRPPGSASDGRQANARGPFDRVNPVEYRETRFDRVWRGKGTAGDVALENAHGTVTGGAVSIPLGTGDQPARARPPPPVRFNPALHERTADLGSDATGDGYKAAPIAEEPAPGLEGAASRAIRGQLVLLGQEFAHCKASLFAEFARPVRLHLSQLEGIEYAFAHGADPVRAEHLLPREADMAYTLARRALWHARKKLASCDR